MTTAELLPQKCDLASIKMKASSTQQELHASHEPQQLNTKALDASLYRLRRLCSDEPGV